MFRTLTALALSLAVAFPAFARTSEPWLSSEKPITVLTREGKLVPFTAPADLYFKELGCEAMPLATPDSAQMTCDTPRFRILAYFVLNAATTIVITEVVVDGPQLTSEQMLQHVNLAISGMSFDGPEPDDY